LTEKIVCDIILYGIEAAKVWKPLLFQKNIPIYGRIFTEGIRSNLTKERGKMP